MNVQVQPIDLEADAAGVVPLAEALSITLFDAAAEADASARIAGETWATMQRAGLFLWPLPSRDGGQDLAQRGRYCDLATVLRLIGSADLSVARLFEGHVNAVDLVARYGTAEQAVHLARDVASRAAVAGVWGADDAAGLVATRVGSRWRLQGRKILASGAGSVTRPIVTASSENGQLMLLLRLAPGERADVSGWTAQGMRATATGSVDLSGLMLDEDQVLGRPGDFMRQPHFSGGAWRFCAVHLGAAERLVDLFREHLTSRGRQGDPYQLRRIADCVVATTTAAFWIDEAARRLAAGSGDAVAFTNLTRMVTERAALDVLEAVHRGVGLQGFIRPHPIERISRDLSTYLRQPVPDLAMADAARAVLAQPMPTARLWEHSLAG